MLGHDPLLRPRQLRLFTRQGCYAELPISYHLAFPNKDGVELELPTFLLLFLEMGLEFDGTILHSQVIEYTHCLGLLKTGDDVAAFGICGCYFSSLLMRFFHSLYGTYFRLFDETCLIVAATTNHLLAVRTRSH